MSQMTHLKIFLHKFGMTNLKYVSTTLTSYYKLSDACSPINGGGI